MTLNLKIAAAAALIAGGLGMTTAANAAPAGPTGLAAGSLIEQVAEGCGPGFFRGPRGFCRPMRGGYGRGFYGPQRYYGGPRRFHDGPRRFYSERRYYR